MEKEPQGELPFRELKGEICGEGGCVNVLEFCERNDMVLKEVFRYGKSLDQYAKAITDYLNLAKEKFPEQYARFFPKTQLVIGKNEFGDKSLYLVQEKIIGEDLKNLALPEEYKQNFKELLSFLIDLYAQTFDGEQGWSVEIFYNYMLGHKTGQDKKKNEIYFVDFTPVWEVSFNSFRKQLSVLPIRLGLLPKDIDELLAKLDVLEQK